MANQADVFTGIEIDGIWLVKCHFEDLGYSRMLEGLEAEGERTREVDFSPSVEVRLSEDEGRVLVHFGASIVPKDKTYFAAEVVYAAEYSRGENPPMSLVDFAWGNGIAYLVPFVRQTLASLTTHAKTGTFLLPPINVPNLLTRTARQTPASGVAQVSGGEASEPTITRKKRNKK